MPRLPRLPRLGLQRNFYLKVLPLVLVQFKLWRYAFTSDARTCQVVLGLMGLFWCFAALWVEIRLEQVYPGFQYDDPPDPEMKAYKPFCDFAPWAKCSRVLMSPPGRFLRYFKIAKRFPAGSFARPEVDTWDKIRWLIDVPNPVLGVAFFGCHVFYPALLAIPALAPMISWLFLAACCVVGLITVWLARCLYTLRDFCVVCVSMYLINFAMMPVMQRMLSVSDFPFFGEVSRCLLYPFLAMDLVMGLAVLCLYLSSPTYAREASGGYRQLITEA